MTSWLDIYSRARAAKVPMKKVCMEAGIHPTTPSRWTPESPPRAKTLEAMSSALDRLVANGGA